MAAAVKLTYLPIAARGFPIRFALRVANVPFEDERIAREALHAGRGAAGSSADFPLGQLPTLRIDGELFTESVALARWAARKSALYPTDELDALRAEEAVAIIDELWTKTPMARHGPWFAEAAALDAARVEYAEAVAPKFLHRLGGRLVASGGGPFLLGRALTIADVWLVAWAQQTRSGAYGERIARLIDEHPALAGVVDAFAAHPLGVAHTHPM
jgi:glutathione S-transferase